MSMKLLQRSTSFVALATLVICMAARADEKPREELKPQEGYTFSLRAEKERYQPEEKKNLVLVVKNVGDTEAFPGSSGFLSHAGILIYAPDGKPTPLTTYGKYWSQPLLAGRRHSRNYIYSLGPGEEAIYTSEHINRTYDMTLAGKYKISGTIKLPKRDKTKEKVTLVSNAIEVIVN